MSGSSGVSISIALFGPPSMVDTSLPQPGTGPLEEPESPTMRRHYQPRGRRMVLDGESQLIRTYNPDLSSDQRT
jgi:hypothetical protein